MEKREEDISQRKWKEWHSRSLSFSLPFSLLQLVLSPTPTSVVYSLESDSTHFSRGVIAFQFKYISIEWVNRQESQLKHFPETHTQERQGLAAGFHVGLKKQIPSWLKERIFKTIEWQVPFRDMLSRFSFCIERHFDFQDWLDNKGNCASLIPVTKSEPAGGESKGWSHS